MDQNPKLARLGRGKEKNLEPEVRISAWVVTDNLCLTVEENGAGLAYVHVIFVTNHRYQNPYALVEDLYVEEGARLRGLGTKLVQAIFEEAKKHGCRYIRADSRDSRPWVHEFYRKLGFKDHGRVFIFELGASDG